MNKGDCEYPNDSRVYTDGVVLIGDAAGYNDPIAGQGLSLAMRDVGLISDAVLTSDHPTAAALGAYATERRERMRRVRFAARVMTKLLSDFRPDAHQRRLEALGRMQQDPNLALWLASIFVGPENVPDDTYDEAVVESLMPA